MAKRIKVSERPYFNQDVILGGRTYNLLFKFNDSDKSWYISLRDSFKNDLLSGIKILPNQNLTEVFSYKDLLLGGNIWCLKSKATKEPLGLDNLGIDKSYELFWLTTEDEEALDVNGTIQL